MACGSCGKQGIMVVRQSKSSKPPKIIDRALQPLVTSKNNKLIKSVITKPISTRDINLNLCPLCKSRLQPVSKNLNGRIVRLLECINHDKCKYVRKL